MRSIGRPANAWQHGCRAEDNGQTVKQTRCQTLARVLESSMFLEQAMLCSLWKQDVLCREFKMCSKSLGQSNAFPVFAIFEHKVFTYVLCCSQDKFGKMEHDIIFFKKRYWIPFCTLLKNEWWKGWRTYFSHLKLLGEKSFHELECDNEENTLKYFLSFISFSFW